MFIKIFKESYLQPDDFAIDLTKKQRRGGSHAHGAPPVLESGLLADVQVQALLSVHHNLSVLLPHFLLGGSLLVVLFYLLWWRVHVLRS